MRLTGQVGDPGDRGITPEVIESCRQGDRDALRALYEAYKDKVYSIAYHFFHRDASMASDITQQVFLKLIGEMGKFRGDAAFSTWLYRLVVNACVDRARRGRANVMVDDPAVLPGVAGPGVVTRGRPRPSGDGPVGTGRDRQPAAEAAACHPPPVLRRALVRRHGRGAELLDRHRLVASQPRAPAPGKEAGAVPCQPFRERRVRGHMFSRHVSRDLPRYVDGDLASGRTKAVESHLAACERCRAALAEYRFAAGLVRQLSVLPAPPSIWASIEEALPLPTTPRVPVTAFSLPRFAFACLLALTVIGAGMYGL